MPVYTKAPRARLAMPSDEDFTVLMPRTTAIPQSGPRPRLEVTGRLLPPESLRYEPRPAAGTRPSPVPASGARRMPPSPSMDPAMAAPPPTLRVDDVEDEEEAPPERVSRRASERPPERVSNRMGEGAADRSGERERVSDRPSARPERLSERTRETRPVMRAQAVVASADDTQMRSFLKSRRGKVTVRALVLLALGGMVGVATEAIVQHRSFGHAAESSALITRAPLSAPSPPSATTLSAASIASAQMQCTSSPSVASIATPVLASSPAILAASTQEAAPHRHHRVRPTTDVAQAAAPDAKTPAAGAIAPPLALDDIAAAAEALSKAKEETMLP